MSALDINKTTNFGDDFYQSAAVSSLRGIGKRYAEVLNNQGYKNLFDLCFNLPFRYLDRTHITKICDVEVDDNFYLIKGYIKSGSLIRGRFYKITVSDETGNIEAIFFNAQPYFYQNLSLGRELILYGPVKRDFNGRICLQHPQITFIKKGEEIEPEKALTPVYHLSSNLAQQNIRKIIQKLTDKLSILPLEELLIDECNPYKISLNQAILFLHAPTPPKDGKLFNITASKHFSRICYEELVAYHLNLLKIKELNFNHTAVALSIDISLHKSFLKTLPFEPTKGQKECFDAICHDLRSTIPMLRLLQGDVGSGKTLVAVMACLQVCRNGKQSVLLAPTELLALQHYKTFLNLLKNFAVNIAILHSSQVKSERERNLKAISSGQAQIIVGTHSVFQNEVIYNDLALAIIDEQHRFGMEQRAALLRKARPGLTLHQLVMTATPIPRTLQLALYSDLSVSTIKDKPKGRLSVITRLVQDKRRSEIMVHLRNICAQGQQAYWVCPLIEENNEEGGASAVKIFNEIKRIVPDLKTELLHGQLSNNQKHEVMNNFVSGKTQILVATTIVEVGVDVPNATVMVIDGADRLGLAQLHQLRGRVGRGSKQGYCILVYQSPQNDNERNDVLQRLNIMKLTDDGFKIAEEDLKMRGPGEVLGTKQSGFDFMRVADLARDHNLLKDTHKTAIYIKENYPEIAQKLLKRWFKN